MIFQFLLGGFPEKMGVYGITNGERFIGLKKKHHFFILFLNLLKQLSFKHSEVAKIILRFCTSIFTTFYFIVLRFGFVSLVKDENRWLDTGGFPIL